MVDEDRRGGVAQLGTSRQTVPPSRRWGETITSDQVFLFETTKPISAVRDGLEF